MKHQKGFSLIELLVVIAIIGILSTIGLMSFSSANAKARDSRREADIQQIRSALEMYRSDCGEYPTGDWSDLIGYTDCDTTTQPDFTTKYLGGKTVQDPQPTAGHPYFYESTDGTSYILRHWIEKNNGWSTDYLNP